MILSAVLRDLDDAADQGRQALAKSIESSVNLAVQNAVAPDLETISGQAKDAVRNAIKAASVSVWTVLPISDLFTLGAFADPDDLVGFGLAGPFDFQDTLRRPGGNSVHDRFRRS